jgi:hypothetical protein
VTGVRYRLVVRLTAADVGRRVVIRWRRPGPDGGEQIADVLGILEEADAGSFAVRTVTGNWSWSPPGAPWPGKWCHHRPSASAVPAPSLPDRHTPGVARTFLRRAGQ